MREVLLLPAAPARILDQLGDLKELVPDIGRGPLAKAKDALTTD